MNEEKTSKLDAGQRFHQSFEQLLIIPAPTLESGFLDLCSTVSRSIRDIEFTPRELFDWISLQQGKLEFSRNTFAEYVTWDSAQGWNDAQQTALNMAAQLKSHLLAQFRDRLAECCERIESKEALVEPESACRVLLKANMKRATSFFNLARRVFSQCNYLEINQKSDFFRIVEKIKFYNRLHKTNQGYKYMKDMVRVKAHYSTLENLVAALLVLFQGQSPTAVLESQNETPISPYSILEIKPNLSQPLKNVNVVIGTLNFYGEPVIGEMQLVATPRLDFEFLNAKLHLLYEFKRILEPQLDSNILTQEIRLELLNGINKIYPLGIPEAHKLKTFEETPFDDWWKQLRQQCWMYDKSEVVVETPKIASGRFKDVYKGTFEGKVVAVARYRAGDPSPAALNAFQREILLMSTIQHSHFVRFLGATYNPPQIIMERLDFTLANLLEQKPKWEISLTVAIQLLIQLVGVVRFLHNDLKIIHRNITPPNILLQTREGPLFLGDLGLSKLMCSQQLSPIDAGQWSAPEIKSTKYTQKVDVFSCGMLMVDIIHHVVKSSIPPALINLVRRCCSPDPRYRPRIESVMERLLEISAAETQHRVSDCVKMWVSDYPVVSLDFQNILDDSGSEEEQEEDNVMMQDGSLCEFIGRCARIPRGEIGLICTELFQWHQSFADQDFTSKPVNQNPLATSVASVLQLYHFGSAGARQALFSQLDAALGQETVKLVLGAFDSSAVLSNTSNDAPFRLDAMHLHSGTLLWVCVEVAQVLQEVYPQRSTRAENGDTKLSIRSRVALKFWEVRSTLPTATSMSVRMTTPEEKSKSGFLILKLVDGGKTTVILTFRSSEIRRLFRQSVESNHATMASHLKAVAASYPARSIVSWIKSGYEVIITGHFEGGSVAQYVMHRVLMHLKSAYVNIKPSTIAIRCVTFGACSFGTFSFWDQIAQWKEHFDNYVLHDDVLFRMSQWGNASFSKPGTTQPSKPEVNSKVVMFGRHHFCMQDGSYISTPQCDADYNAMMHTDACTRWNFLISRKLIPKEFNPTQINHRHLRYYERSIRALGNVKPSYCMSNGKITFAQDHPPQFVGQINIDADQQHFYLSISEANDNIDYVLSLQYPDVILHASADWKAPEWAQIGEKPNQFTKCIPCSKAALFHLLTADSVIAIKVLTCFGPFTAQVKIVRCVRSDFSVYTPNDVLYLAYWEFVLSLTNKASATSSSRSSSPSLGDIINPVQQILACMKGFSNNLLAKSFEELLARVLGLASVIVEPENLAHLTKTVFIGEIQKLDDFSEEDALYNTMKQILLRIQTLAKREIDAYLEHVESTPEAKQKVDFPTYRLLAYLLKTEAILLFPLCANDINKIFTRPHSRSRENKDFDLNFPGLTSAVVNENPLPQLVLDVDQLKVTGGYLLTPMSGSNRVNTLLATLFAPLHYCTIKLHVMTVTVTPTNFLSRKKDKLMDDMEIHGEDYLDSVRLRALHLAAQIIGVFQSSYTNATLSLVENCEFILSSLPHHRDAFFACKDDWGPLEAVAQNSQLFSFFGGYESQDCKQLDWQIFRGNALGDAKPNVQSHWINVIKFVFALCAARAALLRSCAKIVVCGTQQMGKTELVAALTGQLVANYEHNKNTRFPVICKTRLHEKLLPMDIVDTPGIDDQFGKGDLLLSHSLLRAKVIVILTDHLLFNSAATIDLIVQVLMKSTCSIYVIINKMDLYLSDCQTSYATDSEEEEAFKDESPADMTEIPGADPEHKITVLLERFEMQTMTPVKLRLEGCGMNLSHARRVYAKLGMLSKSRIYRRSLNQIIKSQKNDSTKKFLRANVWLWGDLESELLKNAETIGSPS